LISAPNTRETFRLPVRVYYEDTDAAGVVYYANYLVWFEVGRADLLRSLGWSYREMELAGVSLPVIEAHCAYQRPARYDDEIEIRTTGRMLSPVRMEFEYTVIRTGDETVAATGKTVRSIDVPAHAGTAFDGEHLYQIAESRIQKIDADAIIVSQKRQDRTVLEAAAENVYVGGIDIGQAIIRRDVIGDRRIPESYAGDGEFLSSVLAGRNVVYLPRVLCYHNALA